MGKQEDEWQDYLLDRERELAEKHKEFGSSMITLSAGILTISITAMSVFVEGNTRITSLVVSWVCFATILLITILHSVVRVENTHVNYWLAQNGVSYPLTKEMFKNFDSKERRNLTFRIQALKLLVIMDRWVHWIVLFVFLVGTAALMNFTVGNLKTEKEPIITEEQVQHEKRLDIEIKELQLDELQRQNGMIEVAPKNFLKQESGSLSN